MGVANLVQILRAIYQFSHQAPPAFLILLYQNFLISSKVSAFEVGNSHKFKSFRLPFTKVYDFLFKPIIPVFISGIVNPKTIGKF